MCQDQIRTIARYMMHVRRFFMAASDRKLILRPVSVKAAVVCRLRNTAWECIMHYAPASGPVASRPIGFNAKIERRID